MNLSAFDTYVFQTLEVPQLSIDNGSGGSSTKMRSGIDFPIPDALSIDTVLIVNGDVIGYFFDGGSDVRFEAATIGGLTDIFTTAATDYVREIDSEFVGPLYVNTNEGDEIFTVTGACFNSSFVGNAGAGFDTLLISLDNVFGGFFELSGIEQEWTL